jgi:hypothetical protein
MRHSDIGIKKWHKKAIFIDLQKITITGLEQDFEQNEKQDVQQNEDSMNHMKVPTSFLRTFQPIKKRREKAFVKRLSLAELLAGAIMMLCFVIFIYVKMLSLQLQGQEAAVQLGNYAAVSLLLGIASLLTLTSSLAFRRLFPGET